MYAEGGVLTVSERITSGFGPFFAERGRPGFFVPYWENDEGQDLGPTDIFSAGPDDVF